MFRHPAWAVGSYSSGPPTQTQRRFLPQIYHFDDANMVIVMEFLGDCELMDGGLVETGVVSSKVRSCGTL